MADEDVIHRTLITLIACNSSIAILVAGDRTSALPTFLTPMIATVTHVRRVTLIRKRVSSIRCRCRCRLPICFDTSIKYPACLSFQACHQIITP
jgi:hypothetical protein